jgi:type IV pilus assembly protein PilM
MSILSFFRTPGAPLSDRQKVGWIGVDFGTESIKISQLHRHGGRYQMACSLVIHADDNKPFDVASFQEGRVGDKLHHALKAHRGFQGKQAACTVSMANCHLRTLVSAKGSEDEQRELISLEMESNPDGTSEPLEFEFWDASTGEYAENRGMTQLHVLSLPRSFSDCIANNLLRAGLHCQILDAVPFAAVRASEMMPDRSATAAIDSSYAILDWGHAVSTIMIVYNGQPFMTRTLRHCGTNQILAALRQRLKLSSREAEAMLATYGVSTRLGKSAEKTELQNLIGELCSATVRDIVHEIQETLSFMKMQFRKQMPLHFCLLGGGAAIRNMGTLLQQEIHLPVFPWKLRSLQKEQVSPVMAVSTALSALGWEL